MNYKVTIMGKNYELPIRTLAIDEKIEEIAEIDRAYQAGEMTRREAVERIHGFVTALAPGSLPAVDEVDTNELMSICISIISTYDAPARKVRAEAKIAEAKDMLSRPEIQKLIELSRIKK